MLTNMFLIAATLTSGFTWHIWSSKNWMNITIKMLFFLIMFLGILVCLGHFGIIVVKFL
jgi:hypothetical protein